MFSSAVFAIIACPLDPVGTPVLVIVVVVLAQAISVAVVVIVSDAADSMVFEPKLPSHG